jgi:hypothetical protein
MSPAFAALIWWVVPALGLIGALGYVLWVSKFQSKFESETSRSVNNFQKFQSSFTSATAVIESKENLTESSTAPSTAPSDAPFTAPFSQPLDRGEVKPGAPADKPDASGQNFTTPTRN